MVKLPPWVIAISKAKDVAQAFMKYLGAYLEGVPTVFDERVPTMAVDSCGRLYVNPQWCQQWDEKQNGYVLLHEMLHNLLGHADRRKELLPNANQQQLEAWNIAADLCIQQILLPLDAHRPGNSVNIDEWMAKVPGIRRNMATEKYYSLIYAHNQSRPQQGQGGQGQPDDGDDASDGQGQPGDGDSDGQDDDGQPSTGSQPGQPGKGKQPHGASGSASDGVQREYELADDFASAGANLARLEEVREQMDSDPAIGQGSGMGTVRQSLNIRLKRQPDPFAELRAIVGRATCSPTGAPEPTYRKRNRRQECDDLPLPGEFKLNPECVIVVDTSGSMGHGPTSDRVVRAMTAISQGLRRVQRPRVISWDDGLQGDSRIASLRQFQWSGGGGTSMDDAIVMADEKYRPDAIVLVTDGGTSWPAKRTRARLIVALVAKDGTPPSWAKVVDLTKEAPAHVG